MSLPRALHQRLPGVSPTARPADAGALTPLQLPPVLPTAVFRGAACSMMAAPQMEPLRWHRVPPPQVLWPLLRLPPTFWPSHTVGPWGLSCGLPQSICHFPPSQRVATASSCSNLQPPPPRLQEKLPLPALPFGRGHLPTGRSSPSPCHPSLLSFSTLAEMLGRGAEFSACLPAVPVLLVFSPSAPSRG